jgi:membrane-associated phospholipid phosphatase
VPRELTVDDIWNRFADAGRLALIGAAVGAPLWRRDFRGSFNALTAILATSAADKLIKAVWNERRPNGENNNSFPSQHAAECFAAATSLDRTFGDGAGPLAIGLATAVSITRICSGKHHVADVIAGTGIGITAGNLAQRLR